LSGLAFEQDIARGGKLVSLNTIEQTAIGANNVWQQAAIMQYPKTAAFIDMLLNLNYNAVLIHRVAALLKKSSDTPF
jgi:hypothetical protein